MKRRLVAAVPHHDRVIEELRADREYAREYLRAAMEEDRAVVLIALRHIAEAYGGLAKIAEKAESLYRALSPNGNPTLKTFTAVLNALACVSRWKPQNVSDALLEDWPATLPHKSPYTA